VAAGLSEKTLKTNDIRKVTMGERNFTIPPNQKFFVMINGTQGSNYPMYNGKIRFRY
jgi:hypothetical protein